VIMKTAWSVAALLLAFSLLTPGPGWGDELNASYFPLKEGRRWEYNVISDQGATKKLVITNLAPRQVKGTKVTPRKWDLGGATFIELMKQDETGTYRYAEQKGEQAPPDLITPMECHLKFPLAEGSSWNMPAKLGNSTMNLSLTIESLSDEVKVPAGTFKDCVKVKQVGENAAGTSVMGYEWYAPKVGVVKSLVTIKQKSQEGTKSETRTYQLVSFTP
jgi:hypothetical protein